MSSSKKNASPVRPGPAGQNRISGTTLGSRAAAESRGAEDPAVVAEREGVFNNVIGALWLAYLGGALDLRAATRLDEALRKAASPRLPPPLPDWARLISSVRH
jgi:hypothetical protein